MDRYYASDKCIIRVIHGPTGRKSYPISIGADIKRKRKRRGTPLSYTARIEGQFTVPIDETNPLDEMDDYEIEIIGISDTFKKMKAVICDVEIHDWDWEDGIANVDYTGNIWIPWVEVNDNIPPADGINLMELL